MDLEDQLREHYLKQELPADRARRLLVAGRVASSLRRRKKVWRMMAAAAVILGLGTTAGLHYINQRSDRISPPVLVAQDLANEVVRFFSQPKPVLGLVSSDRRVLVEWLRQRGGPNDFQPPPAMAGLGTFGCQVLTVRGLNVYLICFVAGPPPDNAPGTPPALVHLVLAPANQFSPASAGPLTLPSMGNWQFKTWTQGDLFILAASTLSAEQLTHLVGS